MHCGRGAVDQANELQVKRAQSPKFVRSERARRNASKRDQPAPQAQPQHTPRKGLKAQQRPFAGGSCRASMVSVHQFCEQGGAAVLVDCGLHDIVDCEAFKQGGTSLEEAKIIRVRSHRIKHRVADATRAEHAICRCGTLARESSQKPCHRLHNDRRHDVRSQGACKSLGLSADLSLGAWAAAKPSCKTVQRAGPRFLHSGALQMLLHGAQGHSLERHVRGALAQRQQNVQAQLGHVRASPSSAKRGQDPRAQVRAPSRFHGRVALVDQSKSELEQSLLRGLAVLV
eukprot:Amastigsp_a676561_5.p2 type:complete len:286 gc:universal Amastigsp_a676561_5:1414-557(-)